MVTFTKLGEPLYGRLGNQLFQIAATIGISEENNQEYLFPRWSYQDYFKNKLPVGELNDLNVFTQVGFDYKRVNLVAGNWDLVGFFQSEKYFDHISFKVREYFTPSDKVLGYIEEKYAEILQQNTCSVHVRRGDYVKLKNYFPPQSIAYYTRAMKMFPSDTLFIIFSDDVNWCKENFVGENLFFVENEKDIIDLLLMSLCKNHIISNSSFSWWGAWLNNADKKRVICPKYFYGPGVSLKFRQISKDLYAKGFERLDVSTSFERKIEIVKGPVIFLSCKLYQNYKRIGRFVLNLFKLK